MKILKAFLTAVLLALPTLYLQAENDVNIIGNKDYGQVQFAIDELRNVLSEKGLNSSVLNFSEADQLFYISNKIH